MLSFGASTLLNNLKATIQICHGLYIDEITIFPSIIISIKMGYLFYILHIKSKARCNALECDEIPQFLSSCSVTLASESAVKKN